MDWDPETGKPSEAKLLELGLDDIVRPRGLDPRMGVQS
jgi:hypothetical protein